MVEIGVITGDKFNPSLTTDIELNQHINNINNPHQVTASQVTNLLVSGLINEVYLSGYYNIANGIAQLDNLGKIPVSLLPSSITGGLNYRGSFDASLGQRPDFPSNDAVNGDFWIVNVSGSWNGFAWNPQDLVIYVGSPIDDFQKISGSSLVSSVNGFQGDVVLESDNIEYEISSIGVSFLGPAWYSYSSDFSWYNIGNDRRLVDKGYVDWITETDPVWSSVSWDYVPRLSIDTWFNNTGSDIIIPSEKATYNYINSLWYTGKNIYNSNWTLTWDRTINGWWYNFFLNNAEGIYITANDGLNLMWTTMSFNPSVQLNFVGYADIIYNTRTGYLFGTDEDWFLIDVKNSYLNTWFSSELTTWYVPYYSWNKLNNSPIYIEWIGLGIGTTTPTNSLSVSWSIDVTNWVYFGTGWRQWLSWNNFVIQAFTGWAWVEKWSFTP